MPCLVLDIEQTDATMLSRFQAKSRKSSISLMNHSLLEVSTVVKNYIRYGNGKWRYFLTVNGSSTVVDGNRPKTEKHGGVWGAAPPPKKWGVWGATAPKKFLVFVKP